MIEMQFKRNIKKYFLSNKKVVFLLSFLLIFFVFCPNSKASDLSIRLSGKILLQVESKGEAYYVNPIDQKKYYLGRPNDAFEIMRSFGLGVSNNDLNNFLKNGARSNLSGRILIQVQDKGQAYYINPDNLKLYYLGRPNDAFNLMRQLGLGISNYNLSQISSGYLDDNFSTTYNLIPGPGEKLINFTWKYKNKNYNLNQIFNDNLYNNYKSSSKVFYYSENNPPDNLRNSYYGVFLNVKNNDSSIDNLLRDLKKKSDQEGFSDDEFVEFIMAFVQFIPYDFSKNENSPQNFPYETLYKNSGICSDKTFLAWLMLKKTGYGAIIFDYPSAKHSAVAVACSGTSSYNSGYCFVETTNYFPIGVFPGELSSGRAGSGETNWSSVFSGDSLGSVETYQKISGRVYNGIENTINKVNTISKTEKSIKQKQGEIETIANQLNILKVELDRLLIKLNEYKEKNDIRNYNLTINEYNAKVENYNNVLKNYKLKVDIYNNDVSFFNKLVKDFYQN